MSKSRVNWVRCLRDGKASEEEGEGGREERGWKAESLYIVICTHKYVYRMAYIYRYNATCTWGKAWEYF